MISFQLADFKREKGVLRTVPSVTRGPAGAWTAWSWKPTSRELAAYAGYYKSDDPYLDATVAEEDGRLVVRVGGSATWLTPASEGLFGGYTAPFSGPDAVPFQRDAKGKATGFQLDGTWYTKVEKAPREASAR